MHTKCSHQVNLVKLKLECPPPPPFIRLVWHYARANQNSLKESARQFDWDGDLEPHSSSPEEQVNRFSETIMNIARNFIPNNMNFLLLEILPG